MGNSAEIRPRLKKPGADTKSYISGLRVRNEMGGEKEIFLDGWLLSEINVFEGDRSITILDLNFSHSFFA